MPYLLDAIYLALALLLSPWILYKSLTTGKYRRGLLCKLLGQVPSPDGKGPCAWFHGVSVGEIYLLGPVVACFRQAHPRWKCVVSTTTDTGLEEARKHFPDLMVFYWPLDFSWAVRRALRRMCPALVILAEGELWPNFLLAAQRRGVPVAVINGRMSPRSFRNYLKVKRWLRQILDPVGLFAVQAQEYADAFRWLGILPERIYVTGSVKYDGVVSDRHNPKTAALRELLRVRAGDIVWIAGSTQAPEEEITLSIFRELKNRHPGLRLILVPRQRDRFEEVAGLLQSSGLPFIRRSALTEPIADGPAVVLMDTIGELGALWGLADVAFVGGSLDGRRGGQNMIEPAAYGAAVVFGCHVWNFRDTAMRLVQAGAAIQVSDAPGLEAAVRHLLDQPPERRRLGEAAQRLVRSQQGATRRTIDCLDDLLDARYRCNSAA
jgi:3-deoxy-D-manno-octulosonic-acid transferase